MDKNNVWFITTKTNLHVGNENTSSYGLIDLAVQRNVTTGLPCINSSSLKGALSEYASHKGLTPLQRIGIFGSDKTKENKDTKKGQYTFFDANILFLPVQDENNLYHLETSHDVIKRFKNQLGLFGVYFKDGNEELDDDSVLKILKETLQIQKVVKFAEPDDAKFIEWCSDDNLPIIARNVLENGESKNLWYEQVVPAETVFYTVIDDNDASIKKHENDEKGEKKVLEKMMKNASFIQIGANATIGYGYCKFTNLK